MGLILPGSPGWAHCTSNISGTPSTTPGTAVTASATANTDGTSVSLLTALSHDVEYLIIGVYGFGASTNNTSALLDILVDPAGGTSWLSTPIINDLLVGYTGAIGVSGVTIAPVTRWYHFPLWVKSGASIGARVRCATGSQAGRVIVHAFGGNASPSSWWCGQFVTEIAINAGTSKGTDHTAGSTGTFSAWTNLGSTLPAPAGAVQFCHQGGAQGTMTALQYHFEFGVGSTRIGPPIHVAASTSETMGTSGPNCPIFCNLPSGAQLQVRGTCSATAQALDVAAWAVH
jgi:hypothetical protein